ncbi:G-protein coupled receptor GRL101-like protein [Trichoplax sp. H2]|nr:G-protein coupled receptor GRL101-like protein [Trichoplax sp. H2]|eukprot:RDD40974.1 G-protein coupled receptor GRL101-like protein [Trichoplax sp. H2]
MLVFRQFILPQIMSWICGPLGIIANSYILYLTWQRLNIQQHPGVLLNIFSNGKYMRSNRTNQPYNLRRGHIAMGKVACLLFLNLSVADMLASLYLTVLAGSDAYYRQIYVSRNITNLTHNIYPDVIDLFQWRLQPACYVLRFLTTTASIASVNIALIITIDRFILIIFPYQPDKRFTLKRASFAVVIIWIYSISCGILAILLAKFTVPHHNTFTTWYSSLCILDSLQNKYVIFMTAYIGISNVVIYSLICTIYMIIIAKTRSYRSTIAANRQQNNGTHQSQYRIHKLNNIYVGVVINGLIIITNITCWLPSAITTILYSVGYDKLSRENFAFRGIMTALLYSTNGLINPIIFLAMSTLMTRKRRSNRINNSKDNQL